MATITLSTATTIPSISILHRFDNVVANYAAAFMDVKAISYVSHASRKTLVTFRYSLDKKRHSELLYHGLNANPKKVKSLLNSLFFSLPISLPKVPSRENMLLKRGASKEEYESIHNKKMVCKRTWNEISIIEAVAWCGDNFMLVKELIKYIPPKFHVETAQQLQAMLDRPATAENGVYLSPFKALIQAYNEYISQVEALSAAKEWDKLKDLWLKLIGSCQRLLSAYGLQEFCSDEPFEPLPTFTKEPPRVCKLQDGSLLDLDEIGVSYSLYKGQENPPFGAGRWRTWGRAGGAGSASSRALAAIIKLCQVREAELREIIKWLLDPSPDKKDISTMATTASSESNPFRCVIL